MNGSKECVESARGFKLLIVLLADEDEGHAGTNGELEETNKSLC
jgi:hypothetical protein